jgi:hypothetical protein
VRKVQKVQNALLNWIRKRRHEKMDKNSITVQRYLRSYICWKNVRQELRETRETQQIQLLEKRITKANENERDRMD